MNVAKIERMLSLAGYAVNYENIIDGLEDSSFDIMEDEEDGTVKIMAHGWCDIFQEHKTYEFRLSYIIKGRGILEKAGFKTPFQRWLLWERINKMK